MRCVPMHEDGRRDSLNARDEGPWLPRMTCTPAALGAQHALPRCLGRVRHNRDNFSQVKLGMHGLPFSS
jgi:hypothetical protein